MNTVCDSERFFSIKDDARTSAKLEWCLRIRCVNFLIISVS